MPPLAIRINFAGASYGHGHMSDYPAGEAVKQTTRPGTQVWVRYNERLRVSAYPLGAEPAGPVESVGAGKQA